MTRATGPRYTVHFRRRRKGKTNYGKRLALLKAGLPRLVVRKTNRGVIAQLMTHSLEGDEVVACAYSTELKKLGFPAKRNTPTAYLTGLLLASKASAGKENKVVLDCGLHKASKGCLLYAALKGAIDGGLKASCSQEQFPSEDRIQGKHLSQETQEAFVKARQEIQKQQKTPEPQTETAPERETRPEGEAKPEEEAEKPEGKAGLETTETEGNQNA